MKVLVFGKSGQVAMELQRLADVIALDRTQADLSDPAACAKIITQTNADVVINAAAYTNVDGAEADEDMATLVNADAPAAMAQAAAARSLPFLHISTDYVFDGSGTQARCPKDKATPINSYGRTKLLGEQGVVAAGGRSAILRTSWVFSAHGANFVKTMLQLGKDRDVLNIVNDQIGGPTAAADIAATLLKMATALHGGNAQSGIYHYSGMPDVSWKDFAKEIFAQAGIDVVINGIPSSAYPTPAARPLNSRLDCSCTENMFGIPQSDWRNSLRDVLRELGEAQ